VDLLQAVGRIAGIDETFFGETVLAWGASIGDLAANLAVARESPVMAVSACFAGPLFNILFAFGLPLGILTYQTPSWFISFKLTGLLHWLVWSHIAAIVAMLVVVPLNHWRLGVRLAYVLLFIYTVVLIVTIVIVY
jgi:sodium/potassium/calcium exchanger 6